MSGAFNELFSTIRSNLAKSISQVEPILDIENGTKSLHFFNCFFQAVSSVITNLKPKKHNSARFASISVYTENLFEYSSMSDVFNESFSTIRSNLAKSISQVEPILDIENAPISLHFFNCFFQEVISVKTKLKPKQIFQNRMKKANCC